MATNFIKTENALGAIGASVQLANRNVILILGAFKSPLGLASFAVVAIFFGGIAAAYGYADLMYVTRLQSEASNLGIVDLTNPEVIREAHSSAFNIGLPLMIVVSGFIVLLELFNQKYIAIAGAFSEFLLGAAGFFYRAIDLDIQGIKLYAFIACGSFFIASQPFMLFFLAHQIRVSFGKYINLVAETYNTLIENDFNDLIAKK